LQEISGSLSQERGCRPANGSNNFISALGATYRTAFLPKLSNRAEIWPGRRLISMSTNELENLLEYEEKLRSHRCGID